MTAKKPKSPLPGIVMQAATTSAQPRELYPPPTVIGPPWEFPDRNGQITSRQPYVIRSDIILTPGPSSTTSDNSFTGNEVATDGVLLVATLAMGVVNTGAADTNPSMVSLKIYRSAVLIFEMPVIMGQNRTGLSAVAHPNIVVKGGDVVKFGLYLNIVAGSNLQYCCALTIQPFR